MKMHRISYLIPICLFLIPTSSGNLGGFAPTNPLIQATTDLTAYISRLSEISRSLKSADLKKAKSLLPLPEALIIAEKSAPKSQKVVRLHNSDLNSQLENVIKSYDTSTPVESSKALRALALKVDSVKKELQAVLTSNADPRQELSRMQNALNEILKGGEFQYREPEKGFKSWLENLIDRILRWLSTGESQEISISSKLLRWLSLFVIVLIVNSALKRLFYTLKSRLSPSNNPIPDPELSAQLDLSSQMSVDVLTQQSDKLSASGDYKGAVRCLYLSTLLYLDKIRLIRYDQAKTDGEYEKELKAAGSKSPLYYTFLKFSRFFQRKWYGKEPCDESDFLTSKEIYRQIGNV